VKEEVTIDFQRFFIKIGGIRFDVKMKYVSLFSAQPLEIG
jgi:pyruvate decarboxylase